MINTKQFSTVLFSIAVGLVLLLNACTTNPINDARTLWNGAPTEPTPGMSPEQHRLNTLAVESARIRAIAGAGGLGAGALLSALICSELTCKLAVTATGATVGYFAGAYVAQKKEAAETQQVGISNSINSAESSLAFYNERADVAQTVVRRNHDRISELNEQSTASAAELAAYKQEYDNMLDDHARIAGMSKQLSADISFLSAEIVGRKNFKNEDTSALEQKRDSLREINDRMKNQLAALGREFERVPENVRAA